MENIASKEKIDNSGPENMERGLSSQAAANQMNNSRVDFPEKAWPGDDLGGFQTEEKEMASIHICFMVLTHTSLH